MTNLIRLSRCPIGLVVVFSDRAEVRRNITLHLKTGSNEFVVKEFPKWIDLESLSVSVKGDGTLDWIEMKSAVVDAKEDSTKRKNLEEDFANLKEEKRELELEQERVKQLRDILKGATAKIQNQAEADAPDLSSVDKLKEYLVYHQNRMEEVDEELLDVETDLNEVMEEMQATERKLLDLLSIPFDNTYASKEADLLVRSTCDTNVILTLTYIVFQAKWMPSYDMRISSNEKKLKLHYFGAVEQNSGEDWENVSLRLSSACPRTRGEPPAMPTLCVALQAGELQLKAPPKNDAVEVSLLSEPKVKAKDDGCFTVDVKGRTSIKSDSSAQRVLVVKESIPATIEYICMPGKSSDVYRRISATNHSQHLFPPGPTCVYFNDELVSWEYFAGVGTMGTNKFFCSLGLEPDIIVDVDNHPIQLFEIVSRSHRRVRLPAPADVTQDFYTVPMEILSTKERPVRVRIIYQIPKSRNEDIKVIIQNPKVEAQSWSEEDSNRKERSFAILNDDNNLEWMVTLQPKQPNFLCLRYLIQRPKNQKIYMREMNKFKTFVR